MKKQQAPLIIEQHPKDYTGFPFITLIQYHKTTMLCIVDNADDSTIRAFVLDMCGPTGVNEEMVVAAAQDWYEEHASKYPVSIHFAKLDIGAETAKIYRTLNTEFVSRVIGPVSKYPMLPTKSIKRRRRKPVAPSIEIRAGATLTGQL